MREKFLGIICLLTLSSCSDDKVNDAILPHLTVITSVSGLGDMGYNDKIMTGVMNFYEKHNIEMNLIYPQSEEEVKRMISSWQNETQNRNQSLLLLADNQYEKFIQRIDLTPFANQRILLIESRTTDLPHGVSTFYISRYGVSYLAGCMAGEHESATIVAAMSGNNLIEESIKGFSDGYNSIDNNRNVNIIYLSDDETGFSMPDKAFQVVGEINNSFILPLAGGSNSGIYKYSRETPFYLPLVVGMDTDCSLFSPRVPFSIVIHIDNLVEQYLSEWYNGLRYEKSRIFGLDDGITDILISPVFYDRMDIWEDYYNESDYWSRVYSGNIKQAIEIEEQYEKN